MKILAIIGSPLGKGNTYKVVQRIEDNLKKLNDNVDFEYVMLKETNLQMCRGCFLCLSKGDEYCPLKDERADLELKMRQCDGLILAAPVYVYNLPALTKNFVDRFAYISHRPRFHDKKAMVVATTGGVGLRFTQFLLLFPLKTWGFDVVSQLGVITPPGLTREEAEQNLDQADRAIARGSQKFSKALETNIELKPGIASLFAFFLQKKAFAAADKDSADFRYWQAKGWLGREVNYYCKAMIGIVKRLLALAITKLNESTAAFQVVNEFAGLWFNSVLLMAGENRYS